MDALKQSRMPAFLAAIPRPISNLVRRDGGCVKSDEKNDDSKPAFLSSIPRPILNIARQQTEAQVAKPAAETKVETALPPVIRVKKSRSRGCAYALLRDADIIERCVLQRVAVIDGVCVELTRHTKKSKREDEDDATEQPVGGVFVSWGARVESRVPVSEEGIEEYLNSLAGKACPDGLVAVPPFAEGHVSFPLVSDAFAPMSWDIRPTDANTREMLSGQYCECDLIKDLAAAKDRLDELWERPPPPMARSLMTRIARDQLFPCSGAHGGKDHENRAGDKLAEIAQITGLLNGIPAGSAFLDLCGGPGAWSQHLLAKESMPLRGYGFTLRANAGGDEDWKAEAKDEWYEDLENHPAWRALWGADGTGDLLKPGNLEHLTRSLAHEKVLLCVADGGFSDDKIPRNLLELYFYRLFLAELLTAVSCLSRGGKFVCKLYTCFSASTSSLLFLTTRMFDSVQIVKPMSSKATGPERYLVASGFRHDGEVYAIQAALTRAHAMGGGASPLVTPLLTPMVSMESLSQDKSFAESMKAMLTTMTRRQTHALNAVVDRALFLEDMAMESAICTDPFKNMVSASQSRAYESEIHALPTPARGDRREGKGKGKGKGKRSRR